MLNKTSFMHEFDFNTAYVLSFFLSSILVDIYTWELHAKFQLPLRHLVLVHITAILSSKAKEDIRLLLTQYFVFLISFLFLLPLKSASIVAVIM